MTTARLSPASFEERFERSKQLALAAAQAIADNRGQDIAVLDLREQTAIFDFFVIGTGASQRQLRAMCDAVVDTLERDLGDKRLAIEGYERNWVICDFGSVMIHLFEEEVRKFYALEELWADAKRIEFSPNVPAAESHAPASIVVAEDAPKEDSPAPIE